MTTRPILFLDVDGVVNRRKDYRVTRTRSDASLHYDKHGPINPKNVDVLKTLDRSLSHSDLLGAGSVELGDDGKLHCFGRSQSLNIKARPLEDAQLLLRHLTTR